MRCDCCMKETKELLSFNDGDLLVCETCREKIKKCPLCGRYYFDFEEMFVNNISSCYDCYLEEYGIGVED